MAYKRGLLIEKNRLKSKRWEDESISNSIWGHTCDCCGISCVPAVLKNVPYGLWRFEANIFTTDKLDVRRRKFDWILKLYPKLIDHLRDQKAEWCERTGRDDDGWWESMVEKYGA